MTKTTHTHEGTVKKGLREDGKPIKNNLLLGRAALLEPWICIYIIIKAKIL